MLLRFQRRKQRTAASAVADSPQNAGQTDIQETLVLDTPYAAIVICSSSFPRASLLPSWILCVKTAAARALVMSNHCV